MKKIAVIFFLICFTCFAQEAKYFANKNFLNSLNKDSSYVALRRKISQEYLHSSPGSWGEFVKDVDEDIKTKDKIIAFTFDACGGPKRNGYDSELINFLQQEKIPATLGHDAYIKALKDAFTKSSNTDPIFITWGYSHLFHGEMSRQILLRH
jgi:hypothetical protein